jgi:hypothetical protein|nr:MAG TPA: Protein of unknown function (DUF1492) [Caudoviricetes sp.]
MTAKQYLSRIEKLDMLIESKKDELNSFRDTLPFLPSQNLSEERVQASPQKDASFTRSIERVMEMEAAIDKYRDERQEIIDNIYSLSSTSYIKVLSRKYIYHKSLRMVSKELEYSYDWVMKSHKAGLSEIEKLIVAKTLHKNT